MAIAIAEMIDEAAQPGQTATALEIEVGGKLRELRKSTGLTLRELADRCVTTPQTIQRLETANMTLSVAWLGRICAALDVTPFELFSGGDERFERAVLTVRKARKVAQHLDLDLQDMRESLRAFLEKIENED